jgi:hypothetical protein
MKNISLIFNWLIASGLVLGSLISFIQVGYPGIAFLILSLFFFPPVRDWVYKINKTELLPITRAFITIVILVLSIPLHVIKTAENESQAQKDRYQAGKERAELITAKNLDKFSKNRNEILSSINILIADDKQNEASLVINRYKKSNDPELTALNTKIQKYLDTKRLLSQLESTSKSDINRNFEIYSELTALHPENKEYQKKYSSFRQQHYQQAKLDQHKVSIQKQFSSWDGSHIKLEEYIIARMNDPDSYEHVNTTYRDMNTYLIVTTQFRGKNTFGGLVKQVMTAKVGDNGNIIDIM